MNENSWEEAVVGELEGHVGSLLGHGGEVIGGRGGVVAGLARQRLSMPVDDEARRDRTAGAGEAKGEKDLAWSGSSCSFPVAELGREAVPNDPGGEAVAVDAAVLRYSEAGGRSYQELARSSAH